MKQFLLMVMQILGMVELPKAVDDGFEWSAEQLEQFKKLKYSEKEIADLRVEFIAAAKKEQGDMQALEETKAQLEVLRQSMGLQEDQIVKEGPDRGGGEATQQEMSIADQLKQVTAEVKILKEEKEKLAAMDIPKHANMHVIKEKLEAQHSATHFLGTGKDYDAIDNRPWNKSAISGRRVASTDWGSTDNVDLLQKDAELFYRENPDMIESLIRDTYGHPSHWTTRYGVSDRIDTAQIVTGDITQQRKRNYVPSNKQAIKVENGKVWPVQIDLTFKGADLQEIETSWLNEWNNDGSQAYKMSFVYFLLADIVRKARIEDRIAEVRAIFSPVPETIDVPTNYMERQDGLLYLLWKAFHVDKKYKTIARPAPTYANIYDHVQEVIDDNLKQDVKNNPDLYYYMSPTHLKWYKIAYRREHGTEMDFNGEVATVLEQPNIKLCPHIDLEGSNLHFITFGDNIQLLQNLKGENQLFRIEQAKRDTHIFADYKSGIRAKQIGTKVKDGDPASFLVQSVWTNGQPFFNEDRFSKIYDLGTGILDVRYSNMRIADKWASEITEINGLFTGQILKIQGNTAALTGAQVTHGGNINLAGNADFDLKSGGTLYLKVNADRSLTEIKRTAAPDPSPEGVEFTGNSIDSTKGNEFTYVGTSAVTLASILTPIEGRVITITQSKAGAGTALTVTNQGGNIAVNSNAVLDAVGDSIELTVIDGVFTETARNISA